MRRGMNRRAGEEHTEEEKPLLLISSIQLQLQITIVVCFSSSSKTVFVCLFVYFI